MPYSNNTPSGRIRCEPYGVTADGRQVTLFRIPNSTKDYVELINYGCRIKSLYLHDWTKQTYQNQLCGFGTLAEYECDQSACGAVLSLPGCGDPLDILSHEVWDVYEIGEQHVCFSCRMETRMGAGLAVHAKIQWVNLNRLVVDLFATPDRAMPLNFTLNLQFCPGGPIPDGTVLRTFAPLLATEWDGQCAATVVPTAETPYAGQAFVPFDTNARVLFADEAGEIHPMAELVKGNVSISAYTTANAFAAATLPCEGVRLHALSANLNSPAALTAPGETWTCRTIYGFDRVCPTETECEPGPDLFTTLLP